MTKTLKNPMVCTKLAFVMGCQPMFTFPQWHLTWNGAIHSILVPGANDWKKACHHFISWAASRSSWKMTTGCTYISRLLRKKPQPTRSRPQNWRIGNVCEHGEKQARQMGRLVTSQVRRAHRNAKVSWVVPTRSYFSLLFLFFLTGKNVWGFFLVFFTWLQNWELSFIIYIPG